MSGRSKGFAFVEMTQDSDAQRAVADLDGKTVDERDIKVAEARPKQARKSQDSWGGGGGNRDRY